MKLWDGVFRKEGEGISIFVRLEFYAGYKNKKTPLGAYCFI